MTANGRIAGHVRTTPMAEVADPALPGVGWFKCEYMQRGGSFKLRGAFNRILSARDDGTLDPEVGIVAASGGNAGLANALAAAELGVPAHVFVPETAPQPKVDKLRACGARLHQVGTEYAHAFEASQEHTARTGAIFCHAYDQPEIAAGAGTLAVEALRQSDDAIDTFVVAVGGGGLMAGVATAGGARVVGVEPTRIPTLRSALEAGKPVDIEVGGIAADSLGARRIGDIGFDAATSSDVTSVLVPDDAIREARTWLWNTYRIALEYGAACAVAAIYSGAYTPSAGERVAVVLCGANTDVSDLA
nr:threonine/serine dehydratase [Spelaeicoccus albus]